MRSRARRDRAQRPWASRREEPSRRAATGSAMDAGRACNARGHRDGRNPQPRPPAARRLMSAQRLRARDGRKASHARTSIWLDIVLNARGHRDGRNPGRARFASLRAAVGRRGAQRPWASRREEPAAVRLANASENVRLRAQRPEASRREEHARISTWVPERCARHSAQRPWASRREEPGVRPRPSRFATRITRGRCSTPVGIETGRGTR